MSWVGLGADKVEVSFDADIRPILSEHCFQCHGPDARSRKAKLRLDTRDGLFAAREEGAIVVPGKPELSLLIQRITATDAEERMPPRSTRRPLTAEQIGLLRTWIRQGARWQSHWAFEKPVRPDPPDCDSSSWPITAIDRFVLRLLRSKGLRPATVARRRQLLRRVTLDLTGLPPTPEELTAFVASDDANAYDLVVDRLLASPRYGERMAWDWLDAARYADTNGYQGDKTRTMWPYRDWVVDALNRNLPYDEFVTWQLAGDLLPQASFEQRLATGFCRNYMINGEGGRIAEENRVEYIFDTLETVGKIWLGLTLTCARCHDHKYDPVSQRNYYQLFAFFNQTPVTGAGDNPQTPPVLTVRNQHDSAALRHLQATVHDLEQQRQRLHKARITSQPAWERATLKQPWTAAWSTLLPVKAGSKAGQSMQILADRSILVGGKNPAKDTYLIELVLPPGRYTGLRLEALRHATMTAGGLARSNSGNFVLTGFEVQRRIVSRQPATEIRIASARASYEQGDLKVAGTLDGKANTGWAVYRGRPITTDHAAVFRFGKAIDSPGPSRLLITLRHDSRHRGHNLGRFRLSVTNQDQPRLIVERSSLLRALQTPVVRRTPEMTQQVEAAYLGTDNEYTSVATALTDARGKYQQQRQATGKIKVMVMTDRAGPKRPTYILHKGQYDQRRATVDAGVPEVLPALPKAAPANRLALARWLVDPDHPLTARVTVNRHWQKFFGAGLVRTVDDFGAQGEKPSHPQLLAWLASEFVRSGWDLKALHRLIVTSATYRQSARVNATARRRDPDNRLLGRGPRHRLTSWMIRDLVLAASCLLVEQRGGPAVKPYQPAGVWAEATFGILRYQADRGDKLYRRSLYTFWRRIIGPTVFFDTARRQTCSVRTAQTNTPLHALVTLNDKTYVEAARMLAQRLLQHQTLSRTERVARAFELATSRRPNPTEREILLLRLGKLQQHFAAHPKQATRLLAFGESARDQRIDLVTHAAWTGLCSLILNLDEALSH